MKTIATFILGIILSVSIFAAEPNTVKLNLNDNKAEDSLNNDFQILKTFDAIFSLEYQILMKQDELNTFITFQKEEASETNYTKIINELKEEIRILQTKIQEKH